MYQFFNLLSDTKKKTGYHKFNKGKVCKINEILLILIDFIFIQGPPIALGRVVGKPVNADPGLKVNQNINFSCIEMFLHCLCIVQF